MNSYPFVCPVTYRESPVFEYRHRDQTSDRRFAAFVCLSTTILMKPYSGNGGRTALSLNLDTGWAGTAQLHCRNVRRFPLNTTAGGPRNRPRRCRECQHVSSDALRAAWSLYRLSNRMTRRNAPLELFHCLGRRRRTVHQPLHAPPSLTFGSSTGLSADCTCCMCTSQAAPLIAATLSLYASIEHVNARCKQNL